MREGGSPFGKWFKVSPPGWRSLFYVRKASSPVGGREEDGRRSRRHLTLSPLWCVTQVPLTLPTRMAGLPDGPRRVCQAGGPLGAGGQWVPAARRGCPTFSPASGLGLQGEHCFQALLTAGFREPSLAERTAASLGLSGYKRLPRRRRGYGWWGPSLPVRMENCYGAETAGLAPPPPASCPVRIFLKTPPRGRCRAAASSSPQVTALGFPFAESTTHFIYSSGILPSQTSKGSRAQIIGEEHPSLAAK